MTRKKILALVTVLVMAATSLSGCKQEEQEQFLSRITAAADTAKDNSANSESMAPSESAEQSEVTEPEATPEPVESSGAETTATPKPETTKEPTEPTATPKPTESAKPTTTATPKPEATTTPKPEATAKPTATPKSEATPKPTESAKPTTTSTPKPETTATPAPVTTPAPATTPAATPAPTAESTPAPATTPAPAATTTPQHEHTYAWMWQRVTDLGNCTARYEVVDICSDCGYVLNTYSDITTSNHTLGDAVWDGVRDCTHGASYAQYCTACGEKCNDQYCEPLGHKLDNVGNCTRTGCTYHEHVWDEVDYIEGQNHITGRHCYGCDGWENYSSEPLPDAHEHVWVSCFDGGEVCNVCGLWRAPEPTPEATPAAETESQSVTE